jgi:hypothetical protein
MMRKRSGSSSLLRGNPRVLINISMVLAGSHDIQQYAIIRRHGKNGRLHWLL